MSWPQGRYAPQARTSGGLRARVAGLAGILLIVGGAAAVGVAVAAQQHAPQPFPAAAGATGPAAGNARGPSLRRSLPVSVNIPAIGVDSKLLHLGVNSDGTIRVPSLYTRPNEAAWFKYSAAIDVTLADGITAIFRVTGVRQYPKSRFPARAVYGTTGYAALHLITCGVAFDDTTGHYRSSTVVFASLTSSRPAGGRQADG